MTSQTRFMNASFLRSDITGGPSLAAGDHEGRSGVVIGEANRRGKPMGAWFVLARLPGQ